MVPLLPLEDQGDGMSDVRALLRQSETPSTFESGLRFLGRPGYAVRSLLQGDVAGAVYNGLEFAAGLHFPLGVLNNNLALTRLVGSGGDLTTAAQRPEASDVLHTWGVIPNREALGTWEKLGIDVLGGIVTDPFTLVGGGQKGLAAGSLSVGKTAAKSQLLYETIRKVGGNALNNSLDNFELALFTRWQPRGVAAVGQRAGAFGARVMPGVAGQTVADLADDAAKKLPEAISAFRARALESGMNPLRVARAENALRGRAARALWENTLESSGLSLAKWGATRFSPQIPDDALAADRLNVWHTPHAEGDSAARTALRNSVTEQEISTFLDTTNPKRFAVVPEGSFSAGVLDTESAHAMRRGLASGEFVPIYTGGHAEYAAPLDGLTIYARRGDRMIAERLAETLGRFRTGGSFHGRYRAGVTDALNAFRDLGYSDDFALQRLAQVDPHLDMDALVNSTDEWISLGNQLPLSVENAGLERLVQRGMAPGGGLTINPLWSSRLGRAAERLTGWTYNEGTGYLYVPWSSVRRAMAPGPELELLGWKGPAASIVDNPTLNRWYTRLRSKVLERTYFGSRPGVLIEAGRKLQEFVEDEYTRFRAESSRLRDSVYQAMGGLARPVRESLTRAQFSAEDVYHNVQRNGHMEFTNYLLRRNARLQGLPEPVDDIAINQLGGLDADTVARNQALFTDELGRQIIRARERGATPRQLQVYNAVLEQQRLADEIANLAQGQNRLEAALDALEQASVRVSRPGWETADDLAALHSEQASDRVFELQWQMPRPEQYPDHDTFVQALQRWEANYDRAFENIGGPEYQLWLNRESLRDALRMAGIPVDQEDGRVLFDSLFQRLRESQASNIQAKRNLDTFANRMGVMLAQFSLQEAALRSQARDLVTRIQDLARVEILRTHIVDDVAREFPNVPRADLEKAVNYNLEQNRKIAAWLQTGAKSPDLLRQGEPNPPPQWFDDGDTNPFYVPHQMDPRLAEVFDSLELTPQAARDLRSVFERRRDFHTVEEFTQALARAADDAGVDYGDVLELVQTDYAALTYQRQMAHLRSQLRNVLHQEAIRVGGQFGGEWTTYRDYLAGVLSPVSPKGANRILGLISGGKFRWEINNPEEWKKVVTFMNRTFDRPEDSFYSFAKTRMINGRPTLEVNFPGLAAVWKPMLTSNPLNPRFRIRNVIANMFQAGLHDDLQGPEVKAMFEVLRNDGHVRWAIKKFNKWAKTEKAVWSADITEHGVQNGMIGVTSDILKNMTPKQRLSWITQTFTRAITATSVPERIAARNALLGLTDLKIGPYSIEDALKVLDAVAGARVMTPADLTHGVQDVEEFYGLINKPMHDNPNVLGKFARAFRKFVEFGEKLSQEGESQGRALTALRLMEKGLNPTDVVRGVDRFFVDYSIQSDVDYILRSVFPFARFMVGSTRFARAMAENPSGAGRGLVARSASPQMIGILARSQMSGEETLTPEYVKETVALPIPWLDREGNRQFLTSLGLPHETVAQMLSLVSGRPEAIRRVAGGSLFPLLRSPLEAIVDRSFYFGTDYASYRKAPKAFEWMGLAQEIPGKDGSPSRYEVPGWVNEATNVAPTAVLDSTLNRLFDERQSLPWRLINAMTGFRVQSVDEETELQRKISDYLRKQVKSGNVGELQVFFKRVRPEDVPPDVIEVLEALERLRAQKRRKKGATK